MTYVSQHLANPPSRTEVDSYAGATVLEFGTPWCGHCQRAQPLLRDALQGPSAVRHVKVEDGPGQALGRSFGVKLWPTLVFLQDGKEVARTVRPTGAEDLQAGLSAIVIAK